MLKYCGGEDIIRPGFYLLGGGGGPSKMVEEGFFITAGVNPALQLKERFCFHPSVCFADTSPDRGGFFRANTQVRPYGAETNVGALRFGRILSDRFYWGGVCPSSVKTFGFATFPQGKAK